MTLEPKYLISQIKTSVNCLSNIKNHMENSHSGRQSRGIRSLNKSQWEIYKIYMNGQQVSIQTLWKGPSLEVGTQKKKNTTVKA